MIIARAPLRISFFGGGTDLPSFYAEHGPGRVLSCTIDKYVYACVQRRWDDLICAHGIERELVSMASHIKHDLIREALRFSGVTQGVEVTTLADVPGTGTGLGSSSSLTVALLAALGRYQGGHLMRRTLAEGACDVEMVKLGRPIGKQDQYAATYGGLSCYLFGSADVRWSPISCAGDLGSRLMLFYSGQGRSSASVLAGQNGRARENVKALQRMAEQAYWGRELLEDGDLDDFGRLLDEAWRLKRSLSDSVSTPEIDEMYRMATDAGALGGKVCGAGGGGFVLFYAPIEAQAAVRKALARWREMPFDLTCDGVQIALDTEANRCPTAA